MDLYGYRSRARDGSSREKITKERLTDFAIFASISMSRRGGTWMQRLSVPLGFICGAGFLFFARPTPKMLLIGASVSLLGLALRAWAAGHIRKYAQLATSGPYAFTRNPLYLGRFLLGL